MVDDDDGDLNIISSQLEVINGIDGSKIVLGEKSEIIIQEHASKSLTFRAIQFKK